MHDFVNFYTSVFLQYTEE